MRVKSVIMLYLLLGSMTAFSQQETNFVLWQLPSQINTIGNSYVFQTNDGKLAVMDGGVKEEADYLRGFLAALGNHVDIWFVSHPHPDHIGAITEILKEPKGLKIDLVCHSEFSHKFIKKERDYAKAAKEFYDVLHRSGVPVDNQTEPGKIFQLDQTRFKILDVKDEDIRVNPYNNSCMIIRAWDDKKSFLFLADSGIEQGDRLLNGPFKKDLDCDYLQLAHHGQQGVSKDFYRTIKFNACLWPTPSWVYNNDAGKGFNTHILKTIEIRELIDSLGIKKNYISFEGLTRIE